MNTEDPITNLIDLARGHRPFGEASAYGFETRLRAALGDLEPTFSEWVASLSWRFAFAALPILVTAAAILTWQQHDAMLPQGVGDFVAHWAGYFPVDL